MRKYNDFGIAIQKYILFFWLYANMLRPLPVNVLNSGLVCPIESSEMFNEIESTALLIWKLKLHISSLEASRIIY